MTKAKKYWSSKVTTDSTYPPPGTFTLPAKKLAEVMARKDVSPLGLGSAIKMVQFFINRSGKNLSPQRRKELEKAKKILQRKLASQKG